MQEISQKTTHVQSRIAYHVQRVPLGLPSLNPPKIALLVVVRAWGSVLLTSLPNCHILWSFDPMSYLGANYLMVQLTVEQVDMTTNVCF